MTRPFPAAPQAAIHRELDQQLQLLTTELEAARQRLVLQDALVDETKVTSCTCTGK